METEVFDLFGMDIFVSRDHRFGTDALLLARFSLPSPKARVCDLCSGCGIIPMLFFALGKPPALCYAVEIQEEAYELTKMSVEKNELSDRFIPIKADLTGHKELFEFIRRESIDLVTVNPPYYKVNAGAERLSPAQAAARHEIYCDLEQVIHTASLLLKYGGDLKMCHLPERLADIICLMRKYGIEPKVLQFAHNKTDERPYLILISGKKGGKPGMTVEKPVTVGGMNEELFGNWKETNK